MSCELGIGYELCVACELFVGRGIWAVVYSRDWVWAGAYGLWFIAVIGCGLGHMSCGL